MRRDRAALLSAILTTVGVAALAVGGSEARRGRTGGLDAPTVTSPSAPAGTGVALSGLTQVNPPPRPSPARWLAFGGGADPSSNQVSIEADLELAAAVLGPGGVMLFAGGPGASGVYELDAGASVDALRAELGDLFAPRGGRDGRYRPTRLPTHGPATRAEILATLGRELPTPGEPLVVYVDGHGDGASTPSETALITWGGDALTVKELAERLDGARRPLRLVVSACFSGGLGELAFRGADPKNGATADDRCGLFASTWDLEATGCDPDPDRRSHEGYAVHFLQAARGLDRDGRPARIDLDGDGAITMLEAHTRARIASEGLDVPTSTSERWLRHAAPERGPSVAFELPEDTAVIESLSGALGLTGSRDAVEAEAQRRLDALETRSERLLDDEHRAGDELEARRNAVKGELLARWPELDDPWQATHAERLARARRELEAYVASSATFAAYRKARDTANAATDAALETALERAPVERLVRALENAALAGRLKGKGGADWDRYVRFVACERSRLR
jgi:hypothetical protein